MRNRIWLAAAVPPLAWMAQGAFGWLIGSHACPPSEEPLSFGTARILVGVSALGALILSIAGIVAAYRGWRDLPSRTEKEERARYVAMLGLVACVTLTLGLIFNGLPSLFLHQCGEAR